MNIHFGREILYVRSEKATGGFAWVIGNDFSAAPGSWLRRKWTGSEWVSIGRGRTSGGGL